MVNANIGSFFVTSYHLIKVFVGYMVKVGDLLMINEVSDVGGGY